MKMKVYAIVMLLIMNIPSVYSQSTYVSTTALGGGNGSNAVTFNVASSRDVNIKDIRCMFSANPGFVQLWYNPTGINGRPSVNSASGWIFVGSVPIGSSGLQSTVPINLFMPGGSNYGFCIFGDNISYSGSGSGIPTFSPTSFSDGVITIDVGTNVGYGGASQNSHVRGFNGEIGYEIVSSTGNDAGVVDVFADLACPGPETVFAKISNFGKNQVDSVWINWSKNGVVQTPIHYTGLLDTFGGTGSMHDTVSLGVNTFVAGVTDTFDVWTTLPNGTVDTSINNDSSFVYLKPLASGGIFTIGGTTPDYPTFAAAVANLNTAGICSPVVFHVRQGTYNEQIDLGAVVGSSSVNTITFKSDPANTNPVVLTYGASSAADNYVVKVDGARFVTFDSLTITATGSTYGYAVHLKDADDITIKNCEINASSATSVITSIAIYNEPGMNVEDCIIENNKINYGRYGLFWEGGSSSSREDGNIIRNNEIKNFNSYGLSSYYQNDLIVDGNVFEQLKTTSSDTWGMYIQYNYSPSITRNRIELTSTGDNLGIHLFHVYGVSANKAEFFNNMITTAVTTSGTNIGMSIWYGKHMSIYHNSIHCRGGNSNNSKAMRIYALSFSNVGWSRVRNNILKNSGVGEAFYISSGAVSKNFIVQQDHNIYHSTTTTPLSLSGTLHTLASWQSATSFDANSYDYDPNFLSPTDLHIQDTTAADKGANLNIMIDIDGDVRPLAPSTGYDIGADEYIPPTCPFGSGLVAFNPTAVGIDVTLTKGANDISWIFEYGTPGFTPGTGTSLFSTNDTATIVGLNPVTNYCVYGRGICSAGDTSLYVGPYCFRTGCVSTLSGTYTIDNTTPTGGANFNSFSDVMSTLNGCGISGPTTFLVKQGSYNEQIDIGTIVGTSSTNTITFKADPANSLPAVLEYSANSTASNYVVKFTGAEYVIFDSLTINANGSSYAYGFHFVNADNVTVKNCEVTCAFNNRSASSPIYNQSGAGNVVENCTIENNILKNGYYGLYWYGLSSAKENGNAILNNEIIDFYLYGVNFISQSGGRVENNTIEQMAFAPTTAYGLNINENDNVKIKSNKIVLTGAGSNFGLSLSNSEGTNSDKVEVYNNMIVTSFSSTGTSSGMYIGKGKHINVYHNSVHVQGGSAVTGRALFLVGDSSASFGNVNIRNNIFANSGLGVAMEIDSGAVSSYLDDMDNNVYSATSGDLIRYGAAVFNTLPPYVAVSSLDANSLSGNPGFISGVDLHLLGAIAYDNGDPTVGLLTDIDGDVRPLAPSTGWDIGADEYTPPSCPSPFAMTVNSILTTSAIVSWTNGPADISWQLEYGAPGFAVGTGTIVNSTSNPTTVSGLSHSTCYEVWLRSICAVGDTSVWTGPYRFCTQCAPSTDYCTNFDLDRLAETPMCWGTYINTTGNGHIQTHNNDFRSSGQCVQFNNTTDASAIMMLAAPEVSNLAAGTHRANFWAKGDSTIVVGTMTNPANPGTFTPWDTVSNPSPGIYTNYKVDFSTYTGTDRYVAIWWVPGTTNSELFIDDYCWEFAPSCEKAPSVTILNAGQSSNSINLGWNSDTSHVSYVINYGPTGYDPVSNPTGGQTTTSTINFVSVGGLNAATEYCFWVKSICTNGDTSFWEGPNCGTTGCGTSVGLPYFNNFSTYKFVSGVGEQLPQCWTEGKGVLTNSSTLTMGTSEWLYDGFANVGSEGAARMNIKSTNRNEWFVSPVFNLGTNPNTDRIIEFDIAMTDRSNTSTGTAGADDSLAFVISTDGGLTWSNSNILELWDAANTPSNTGDHITHVLSNTSGSVQFAFYATSSVTNENNDWFVDNFSIKDSVASGIGIEEVNLINNFKVYPNPNNGVFTILNEGNSQYSNVKLLDVQGRVVYDNKLFFARNGSNNVEVNNFTSGVYVLVLQGEGKQEQHRVVIQ